MSKIIFIAELCQNHNGSFNNLKEMAIKCARSGADIIKLQYIFADALSFRPKFEKGIKNKKKILTIKRPFHKEKNRLKKLEIKDKELKKFINLCKKLKVKPAITCFRRSDISKIKKIGFDTVKVASYDCASFQLIRELKNRFKNIIVSTGATYDDEIKNFFYIKGKNFSLLHCVTIYPTPINFLNLNRINYLKGFTTNVGFSDHSIGFGKNRNLPSLLAIFNGAKYIERHITILDKNATKDGKVSIQPEDIIELKKFSILTKKKQKQYLQKNYKFNHKKILGKKLRKLTHLELLNRDYYRGRFVSYKNDREINNWDEISLY